MAKKKSLPKKQAQAYHMRARALQRYGIFLNRDLRVGIIDAIQNSKSVYVRDMNNRLTLHFVKVKGQVLPVVYDKSRQSIATVLPERVLRRHMDAYRRCRNNGNVTGT